MGRKLGRLFWIVPAGCALGMAMGYGIALELQLRAGRAELLSYASRLRQTADMISAENAQAVAAISHDEMEFCSDMEIALMRDYVFHAHNIRDLGRTRDGMLVSTTGVGRLFPPVATGPPDIV